MPKDAFLNKYYHVVFDENVQFKGLLMVCANSMLIRRLSQTVVRFFFFFFLHKKASLLIMFMNKSHHDFFVLNFLKARK